MRLWVKYSHYSYFFPAPNNKVFDSENVNELNQELLLDSEQLLEDDLKRIIAQARALVDYNE